MGRSRFVRYMVHHYKDRVHYQEIWNEPVTDMPWGGIDVVTYSNLIRRVVPVIRQEYPEAKIVTGGHQAFKRPISDIAGEEENNGNLKD